MYAIALIFLLAVSQAKTPSLPDALSQTNNALSDSEKAIQELGAKLAASLKTASPDQSDEVKEDVSQLKTDMADFEASLQEIIEQIHTEMSDYAAEKKELEENEANEVKGVLESDLKDITDNEADEIKGLGEEVQGLSKDSETALEKLLAKIQKEMKKAEPAPAPKAPAKPAAAAKPAPAVKAPAKVAPAPAPAKKVVTSVTKGPLMAELVLPGDEKFSTGFIVMLFVLFGAAIYSGYSALVQKYSPIDAVKDYTPIFSTETTSLISEGYYQSSKKAY